MICCTESQTGNTFTHLRVKAMGVYIFNTQNIWKKYVFIFIMLNVFSTKELMSLHFNIRWNIIFIQWNISPI